MDPHTDATTAMDTATKSALTTLTAQYYQQLPPSRLSHTLPAAPILIRPAVQTFLYEHKFNEANAQTWPLPPAGYRLRVLKMVLGVLEGGVGGEDDEIIDPLMNAWSELLVCQPKPVSDIEQVQQLGFIKYTAPATTDSQSQSQSQSEPRTIITSESPSLILSSGTTGCRTWEAALHLATYLSTDPGAATRYIRGKRVLELGAGTGLLSLFLARYLQPTRVVATDREETLVQRIGECAGVNAIQEGVLGCEVLVWGRGMPTPGLLPGEEKKVDTAVGADLIYDKDLIPLLLGTLITLFEEYALQQFLVSATLRNPDTFEAFLAACRQHNLTVTPVPFESPPEDQQTGFFHSTGIPIRTFVVSRLR